VEWSGVEWSDYLATFLYHAFGTEREDASSMSQEWRHEEGICQSAEKMMLEMPAASTEETTER